MSGWRTDTARRSAALRLQSRYRQHVHAVMSMVNVVNSEFPMYQILDFQCSRFVSLNVADSRFSMCQIRTFQRGRFGSVDDIRHDRIHRGWRRHRFTALEQDRHEPPHQAGARFRFDIRRLFRDGRTIEMPLITALLISAQMTCLRERTRCPQAASCA